VLILVGTGVDGGALAVVDSVMRGGCELDSHQLGACHQTEPNAPVPPGLLVVVVVLILVGNGVDGRALALVDFVVTGGGELVSHQLGGCHQTEPNAPVPPGLLVVVVLILVGTGVDGRALAVVESTASSALKGGSTVVLESGSYWRRSM